MGDGGNGRGGNRRRARGLSPPSPQHAVLPYEIPSPVSFHQNPTNSLPAQTQLPFIISSHDFPPEEASLSHACKLRNPSFSVSLLLWLDLHAWNVTCFGRGMLQIIGVEKAASWA
ncbi:hypothetical protein Droror1_Dr00018078 [Drosera rotundifolia]